MMNLKKMNSALIESGVKAGFLAYFILRTIVGFFIFVSTCILERVFSHLEGMCSDCK